METWLNDSVLSHNLFLDSYCVYRADRNYSTSNTKRRGEVLTAVSKSFRGVKRRYDLETATSVYGLKFLSTTIAVYSLVITIFHLIVM
jgi:hypothetical protein